MVYIFPSFALRSLEKCFGIVKEKSGRIQLFRLLVISSEKVGNQQKTLQYADNLLEISPKEEVAINAIGRYLVRQPEIKPKRLPMLIKYGMLNRNNKKVVGKTGQAIKNLAKIEVDQLDFLEIYAQKFPDDKNMFALIGRSLLEIPATELPDSAIRMLQTAWKATDSDELWWNFWRTLMVKGKYELAIDITEQALERGKPISSDKLLEVFDSEQIAEAQSFAGKLNAFDQKIVIETAKNILVLKYINEEMRQTLEPILETLVHEENTDVSAISRQALDHIIARFQITERAIKKMLCISSGQNASDFEEVTESGLAQQTPYESEYNENEADQEGNPMVQDYTEDASKPELVNNYSEENIVADKTAKDSDSDFSSNLSDSEVMGLSDNQSESDKTTSDSKFSDDFDSYENNEEFNEEPGLFDAITQETEDDEEEEVEWQDNNLKSEADSQPLQSNQDNEQEISCSEQDKNNAEFDLPTTNLIENEHLIKTEPGIESDETEQNFEDFVNADEIEEISDYEVPLKDESELSEAGLSDSEKQEQSESDEYEDYVPEDYSDYIVGSSENGDSEQDTRPDDYRDYLIGTSADNKVEDQKKETSAFDAIQEYNLSEVDEEELKELIGPQTLLNNPDDSKINKRRRQMFADLDQIAPSAKTSEKWRRALVKKPSSDLFADLE
jgi:hypothetical protein